MSAHPFLDLFYRAHDAPSQTHGEKEAEHPLFLSPFVILSFLFSILSRL